MRKPKKEIQLTSYDELLGINEAEQNSFNQVFEVPLNELYPFKNHPFHVNDDEKMAETVESIKNYGILNPARRCMHRSCTDLHECLHLHEVQLHPFQAHFYHDRAVRTFSCFYSCGNPFSETDLYFFRKQ